MEELRKTSRVLGANKEIPMQNGRVSGKSLQCTYNFEKWVNGTQILDVSCLLYYETKPCLHTWALWPNKRISLQEPAALPFLCILLTQPSIVFK